MSVSTLFRKGGLQWLPDSDAVNAPEQALLRADNLVPDQTGALALRQGSAKLHSSLNATGAGDVTAIHTVELANGTTYRVAGIDDRVFINGTDQGVALNGTGDLAIGNDSYQMFMARGTTKKKWDGSSFMNWPISGPEGKVTLAAVAAITKTAADFDSTESPATSADEGTSVEAPDVAGTANAARLVTPSSASSRAVVTRLFTTDQDFFSISGADGSETDLFDVYVKFEDPQFVEDVTVIFGADDSSTLPFVVNRFEYKFDFRSTISVNIKDPNSEGYGSYEAAIRAQLTGVLPKDVSSVRTPVSVKTGVQQIGTVPSPKSGVRPDPNVWGKLSVTRGQFKRIGSTTGRGWDTIRGFQVVYKVRAGYTKTATFSDALFIGGGDRSLTGTFRVVCVAARTTDTYTELSVPSEESEEIHLNHQTLQVTIPAAMINAKDAEVDEFRLYIFGGFLDRYYRAITSAAEPQSGQTLEELTTPDGSDFDDADERSRLTSHGMTMQSGSASSDIILTLPSGKSEMDILTENDALEPYSVAPPDDIVAIAGPWNDRMFLMTAEGYVQPTSQSTPSLCNSLHVLDLTRYGNPLWMAMTASGIVCGMEKDVVFLAGSGDESPDMTTIDLFPQPLNVGNPPIDKSFAVDGNAIVYRSADGLMTLAGSNLAALPSAGNSLLWRSQDRHDVEGLNLTTGRFRMAFDNLMLYVLAPEGDSTSTNVIYRYSFPHQQWSRLVFDQVETFLSIYKEPSGALVAGDSEGNVWQLDTGAQDDSNDVSVNIRWPLVDGGNPLAYKDAFDLQVHANTGGGTATIALYKEGSGSETSSYTFSTTEDTVSRIQASDFGRFLYAQPRLTGSFSQFSLRQFNLTYRARPQHQVYLDSGYILPNKPGDIVWLQEVEVDAICANDFSLILYHDDVEKYRVSVSATVGVRTTYVIPLPRGSQAKRPRIVLKTQAANASGAVGFDVYGIQVRVANSGNENGSPYLNVMPAGSAT